MSENNVFNVLSDAQRRGILEMLREGSLSAGEISSRLGVTPAALSYHLRLLKGCGLVNEYREKNYIYYELNTSVLDELVLWIGKLRGSKNEKACVDNGSSADTDNGGVGAADA